jgi:hypothetical protein
MRNVDQPDVHRRRTKVVEQISPLAICGRKPPRSVDLTSHDQLAAVAVQGESGQQPEAIVVDVQPQPSSDTPAMGSPVMALANRLTVVPLCIQVRSPK